MKMFHNIKHKPTKEREDFLSEVPQETKAKLLTLLRAFPNRVA